MLFSRRRFSPLEWARQDLLLAVMVVAMLIMGSLLVSEDAQAQDCGNDGQRACCLSEAPFGACQAGLLEIPQANAGQCSNWPTGTQSSSICVAVTACSGIDQRACCVGEGDHRCDNGLIEQPFANAGYCATGAQSSSVCRATTACGGAGQRACCASEAGFGACQAGLVEIPQANSGQCSNQVWGIQSSGICAAITDCGGTDQRACCSGEAGFGACQDGLTEQPQANSGQCGNLAPGIQSSGICRATTACGGEGQRACCSSEAVFGACMEGFVEIPQADSGQCSNQAWGIQSSGICAVVTECGGINERSCCAGEAVFGACEDNQGLVEKPEPNSGQCGNLAPGFESSGICRATAPCGDEGQRACCSGEAGFGACMAELTEIPIVNAGQCSNQVWGIHSSGYCATVTECGGPDQRACCAGEAGFGACQDSLIEQPQANSGQCGNLVPGIQSSGMCRVTTECGGDGQRACCAGEEAFGACKAGFVEEAQANSGQCSNLAWGTQSNSICRAVTACGGPGQRACCAGESAQACQASATEVAGCAGDCLCDTGATASSTCITASACGGPGQRACCIGEALGTACQAPAIEIPGCSGDCYCGPNASAEYSSTSCGVIADDQFKLVQIEEPTTGCVDCEPEPQASECSLRGVADMHTHMFADLGHGGGGFVGKSYDPAGGVNEALKQDYGTDLNLISAFKGGLPLPMVDDGLAPDCPDWLKSTGACAGQRLFHGEHGTLDDPTGTGSNDQPKAPLGAPLFNGWPTWTTTVHQQMYYKWIERAYRGGLRLMVMHAVHSEAFCEVSVQLDGVDCSDSMAQIDLQLQAAYDFQAWLDGQSGGTGEGWFRIVKTPKEARQVIQQGKLAVTLGIEVDNIFNCKATGPCPNMPGHPELDTLQKAVDYYYDWGVRHIFPVHNFDNAFAGTATWLDPLAAGNRFVEQQWTTTQDCSDSPGGETGYGFRHSTNAVNFLLSLACSVSNETTGKCVNGSGGFPPPFDTETSCNVRGLSAEGVKLMAMLMDKGMLIDIDHMSNESLDGTLQMAEGNQPNPYPLVASHGLFFDLHEQLFGDDTDPIAGAGQDGRHERLRTRAQLDRLRGVGSLIAVMTMDNAQIGDNFRSKKTVAYTPASGTGLPMPTITDDCRHSTKTWAQSYEYAVDVMGGPVALGTDFNGVASHLGPRFGADGCGGESGTISLTEGRLTERSAQERSKSQLSYPFTSEYGTFDRQVTGQKAFDFNVDGLAHVGLLPDMLADLKKIGLSDQHLEPLFNSANRYIEVWEGARNERCGFQPLIFRNSFETTAN